MPLNEDSANLNIVKFFLIVVFIYLIFIYLKNGYTDC
jgi:hypothetical protein